MKYLNNLIEQDHRPIKRRSKLYQGLRTPQPRLRAWRRFEEYTRKAEKMGISLAFRFALKSKVYWGFQLKKLAIWDS